MYVGESNPKPSASSMDFEIHSQYGGTPATVLAFKTWQGVGCLALNGFSYFTMITQQVSTGNQATIF